MALVWSNGHSNTETFSYILNKMRAGITPNKSVVKDDKADEDAVKAGEKHEKPVERGFKLLTTQNLSWRECFQEVQMFQCKTVIENILCYCKYTGN